MVNRRDKIRNYPLLTISQRHPYVLHRFKDAVGRGYVNGPYHNRGSGAWYYRVNGYNAVREVGELLLPFLSPIKVEQYERVIRAYEEVH